jgi:antitoxin (DNA-binding transcriptional repressor) of toxin-antitoxin stability system
MRTVEISDVKDLSGLLKEADKGKPFVIAQDGKPLLQVTAIEEEKPKRLRRLGFMKGQISTPADFDTMFQDEIIAMFEGEEK